MARKSRIRPRQDNCDAKAFAWNAVIYLRLSVEDGDDVEQNSIGNQKKICLAYIEKHEDINLASVYMDHGHSGMTYDRPGFQEMYDAILSGQINCVIVKDISRFGRHYIITSEYLQKTFPDMEIRFIAVNDEYDSMRPDADVEGLLLPFKMILNDSYAKDISKKIRSSISAKMKSGEYLASSGSIPYGYIRDPENNTFMVDKEAAPVILRMFELRTAGMLYSAIARQLNADGIPSPGKLRAIRNMTQDARFAGASWGHKTVQKILCDPVYIGQRIHGKVKRDRIGSTKKRRNLSEWQIINNAHPAIISQELFDAAQEVNQAELARRSQFHKRGGIGIDYRDILRDKVFCGDCGMRMTALKRCQRIDSEKPAAVYYQCNTYQRSFKAMCENHYTRQDIIIDAINRILQSQLEVIADLEAVIGTYEAASENRHDPDDELLLSIRVKRKNTEAKLEQLLVDLTDGLLNKDEYDYLKSRYSAEHKQLLHEESLLEQKASEKRQTVMTAKKWLKQLKRYHTLDEFDREMIDLLVKRVLIYKNNIIHVELSYSDPYNELWSLFAGDTKVGAE